MRVAYEEMAREFARVLEKKGFAAQDAADAADIFAQNSLAGVYSHGLNRFPRIVRYLDKGEIDPRARATCDPVSYTHLDVYKRQFLTVYSMQIQSVLSSPPLQP